MLPAVVAHGLQPPEYEGGAGEAGAASGQDTRASSAAGSDVSWSSSPGSETDPAPDWTGAAGYEELDVVSKGSFGTVFLGRDRNTNERVAIKRIGLDGDQSDGVPAHVLREVSVLRGLVHPNIVLLKGLQVTKIGEYQLIFEYVPTDLHRVLRGHRHAGTKLPMASVLQYFAGLLNGIHACHVHQIMHRDLKPQNVLIHPVDGLKICDFGSARTLSPAHLVPKYTQEVITLWYRGPELLLGQLQYGLAVDLWSAGCIFAEMATSYPAFPGDSEIGTLFKIMQLLGSPTEETWPGFEQRLAHWSPHFPRWQSTTLEPIYERRPELGDAGVDLMRALLALNPASRPTARRARAHAFFSQACSAQRPCST